MMKYLTTLILFMTIHFTALSEGTEKVCVVTSSQEYCTAGTLGPVNPCSGLAFLVKEITPPSGYTTVGKFEWYVNDVLTYTSTDPTNPIFTWTIKSKNTNVYCKVSYKDVNGNLSTPYTSTSFTPNVKDLDFPLTITASNPSPNYGCSELVSYTLNETICSGNFCDYTYNVLGNYTISWQAPSGWVQHSISTNGSEVSFVPNGTSAGPLTATILLPCGYTDTRTFNITRASEPPTFVTSTFSGCNNSVDISINPVCGATDYTYSIIGNPGIKFSNNQQVMTTANTTVTLTLPGGNSLNTIKSKANYINNPSSIEAISTLTVGSPTPGQITFLLIDPMMGKIQARIEPVPGATSYQWFRNGAMILLYTGQPHYIQEPFIQFPIPRNNCDIEYDISVVAVNDCGISNHSHENAYVPCDNYFRISPNPATSMVTISSVEKGSLKSAESKVFDEIKIYTKEGILKKIQKTSSVTQLSINISGLKPGVYFIEISGDDNFKEIQKLIVQN